MTSPMTASAKHLVKFAFLVGLGGIFFDAVIAHGLFWDNDPYWTYWITKTFLITTVFLFGSSWLGIGIWQGLVLSAVHTLILEVYYQWLSPVGLPQEPEWLDFGHVWLSGVPAHFLAILGGYFLALWLWRRNHPVEHADGERRAFVLYALLAAVLILVFDGFLTQGLLLRDWPGITYFVQHLLTGFVFVAMWTAYAGAGLQGRGVGALMLALLWTGYGLYLGPRGLPSHPPVYPGYGDLWGRAFPGAFIAALAGWWLAGKIMKHRRGFLAPLVLVVALPMLAAPRAAMADAGLPATATASGTGMRVTGPAPVDMNSTTPIEGTISVEVREMGGRWSHVQNTDAMKVIAAFTSNGTPYEVTITRAMPRHPEGWYTTWNGVVLGHEMHGNTGIGTAKLPKMAPEIALWGWAEVKRGGDVIARSAPAHVMVSTGGPMPGVMLEVATEDKSLVAEPDGYITVVWPRVDSLALPESTIRWREGLGWTALVALTLGFGLLAQSTPRHRT